MTPLSGRGPSPHPPRHGLFLSFEGGDSAGKSTQIALLREHLISQRHVAEELVLTTREPGGTELGSRIRDLVLHGGHVDPRAEALLYAADRAHHVATVVAPHLDRGGLVLADRYIDSSVAYQGAGRELDAAQVRTLSLWATGGLMPHRTILLDLPPEALDERRSIDSLDRLERAGREFHRAVRRQFLQLAEDDPERFVVIDASGSRKDVHAAVLAAIATELEAFDPSPESSPQSPAAPE
ncbi:dTMP kinase [Brachybacterium sp. EF45031]|uniref:dTMP kinase n=1 Tax=Brachybacterium sillae TaxID=2810536 RepID=UPI00217D3192|nr:dTMP kinase [Brachybacterium sillae]MCS6712137.1 dTMP kinase [Brachybacterium sillae]